MSQAVLSFFAELAVKSTLLLALATVAACLARKGPAALRHRIWCSAMAGVAVLPLVMLLVPRLEVPVLPAEPPNAPMLLVVRSEPLSVSETAPASEIPIAPERRQPFPWNALLLAFYGAGAAASALGLALSLRRLRFVARRSSSASARQYDVLQFVASALDIAPPILRVAQEGGPTVPMTWGARRPVLLLPRNAETWSDRYLHSALAHEAAHIRRRDWAIQLAVRAICIFYWFHPLARWAAARLRIEGERACDDLALLSGIHAADYAACLLEVTRMNRDDRRLPVAAVPMAQTTALEERLRAVLDAEAQRRERRRGLGVVIGGAALTAVLVTGALQATPSRPSAARTTDMALGLGMIQGRASVQIAQKSKAALQSQVNALRARLRATEAEVRRLRSQPSDAARSFYSHKTESGAEVSARGPRLKAGDAAEGAAADRVKLEALDRQRLELEQAQANRDVAAAALAEAQADQIAVEAKAKKQGDLAAALLAEVTKKDLAIASSRSVAEVLAVQGTDLERRLRTLRAERAERSKDFLPTADEIKALDLRIDAVTRQLRATRAATGNADASRVAGYERAFRAQAEALEAQTRAKARRDEEGADRAVKVEERRAHELERPARKRAEDQRIAEQRRQEAVEREMRRQRATRPDSSDAGGGRMPNASVGRGAGASTDPRSKPERGGGGGATDPRGGLGMLGAGDSSGGSGLGGLGGGGGLGGLTGGGGKGLGGGLGGGGLGGFVGFEGLGSGGRTSAPAAGASSFGGDSGRRAKGSAARSYDEALEELQDQVRHIDLDITAARRRFERASERVKLGITPVDEAEEAQLKLQHLELDREIVMRKIKRHQATRRPGGSSSGGGRR